MNTYKTLSTIVAVLGLAISISTGAVQDVGLPNASLENWTGGNLDNWTNTGMTWASSTSYVQDGTYTMNAYSSVYQYATSNSSPITAGALYDARYFVHAIGTTGHSCGYIRWYDSSNAFISDSVVNTTPGYNDEIRDGSRWYYEAVRAPTNAASAAFRLKVHGRDSSHSLYLDAITMYGGAPVNTINETIETRNAGLEVWNSTTSPDGWTVADGQQHTGTHKNSGSYSLQIDSGAAYQTYSWGEQIVAGNEYEAKFWAWKSATGGHARGYLRWYDENYAVISTHTITGNTENSDIYAGTRWYDETLTAPTGATRARFSIEGVASTVTVCVDDVTLTNLTPEPATMALLLLGLPLALRRRRKL